MVTYMTESFKAKGKKKTQKRLESLINEKAEQGWKLTSFSFDVMHGRCIVVFEKAA